MSPGPFRWRGWLNFHWMNECLNAHGFMDRVQSVTSFIALSVQKRMGSSAVDFNHASSPFPGCWLSRICRLLSQIWTLTTLTSYTVWMHVDIKLLPHTDGSWYVHKGPTEVTTQYTYVQLYICIPKGSSDEIQTQTHRNLNGRSMTAPPPVLSPSSFLLPQSSHCVFIPASKKFGPRL
jgi:hypothetical protein